MSPVVGKIRNLFKHDAPGHFGPLKAYHYLNTMSEKEIVDLLRFSEQTQFLSVAPPFENKRVLLISHAPVGALASKILEEKPKCLVEYKPSGAHLEPSSRILTLKGDLKPLSLKENQFDVVLFPSATLYKRTLLDMVDELSRVLAHSGRMVFSVAHPTLLYLLMNQNPHSNVKAEILLQDYLLEFRKQHLFLENLSEPVVNRECKAFFMTQGDDHYFEEFRGTPLVQIIRAVKYVRQGD